jgi:hypothetical protein
MLVFTSNLKKNADLVAWGFKNLKVSFLECPGDCGICYSSDPRQCAYY